MYRKFFISHSSADRDFVVWLAAELLTLSIPVWYSDWEIKVGDSIVEKIDSALQDVAGLIVVLSASSVRSKWVREELNAALWRRLAGRNVPVFPIRIDQAEAPPLIAHRKYADFSLDRVTALGELAEALVPAAAVIQRIRDLRTQCAPLLNRLKAIAYTPITSDSALANPDDDVRSMLLGITSLLERAVEERYLLEIRQERPDRQVMRHAGLIESPTSHPERFAYLVDRGYELRNGHWERLVELRAQYLHRLGYIEHTLMGLSEIRSMFPDFQGHREEVERITWLDGIFGELISGPRDGRPSSTK